MRFGACTWLFGDEPLPTLARRIAALGLDGVELFGDVSLDPRTTRQIFAEQKLDILSLTPANVDLCHPDVAIRRVAGDYYARLVDFAAAVGAPLVACHGMVGRVRAVNTPAEEWVWMVEAVREIAARAARCRVSVVVELLNRYEAHLLNNVGDGLCFVREVGADNVGLLLDAYHMNLEEADLARALASAQEHLRLFHVADSNRQAVGRGHTNFRALVGVLRAINYRGDIVFECPAAGPDPFTALKGADSRAQVEMFLRESLVQMQAWMR